MSNRTTRPKQPKESPQTPSVDHWVGVVVTFTKGLEVTIPNTSHLVLHAEAGKPIVWRFENLTTEPLELGVGRFATAPAYTRQDYRYPLKEGKTSVPVGAGKTEMLECEILPHHLLDFFGHKAITYKYDILEHGRTILDPEIEIPNPSY